MNDTPPRARRRWLLALPLLLAAPLLVLAPQVDDWSRDLTTNLAETALGASDPRLRPLRVERPPEEVRAAIEAVAAELPGWAFVGEDAGRLHFERTSGLFRFVDDVWVWVEVAEDGACVVQAKAQSRVGKGDLGQNPRTLDALLRALEAALPGARPLE